MSMIVFLIIQSVGMFFIYFGITTVLPMIVFHNIIKHRRLTDRILLSYLFGNVYIVTVVQILQLLHISCFFTLLMSIAVPAVYVWVKVNGIPVKDTFLKLVQNVKWITQGQIGIKTVIYRIGAWVAKRVKGICKVFFKWLFHNLFEVLLILLLLAALMWIYGVGIVSRYGYTASDLPVHNYWINAMYDNNIFVAGVYPHGYHCILYFMHELFGFDTYILLSLFAFVQVFCIHFALLFFLKLCCKLRYLPYIGVFAYLIGDFFVSATYSRYSSTLPQEYGMIFILPAIAYGFMFFKERYTEVKNNPEKKESIFSLWGFAMSFGMTLSVHFYDTVIVALFCVAMAIGYFFLFVRKQYFLTVVVTCLISVLVAILPMGIAFATGTPLQGSLGWATNVILGTSDDSSGNSAQESDNSVDSQTNEANNMTEVDNTNNSGDEINVSETGAELTKEDTNITQQVEKKESFKEKFDKVKDKINHKINVALNAVDQYIWREYNELHKTLLVSSLLALFVLGLLYIIIKKSCYGAMLWSGALYIILMIILLASGKLGIPKLMDPARSCIYFAYSLPLLFVFVLDGVLYLLTGLDRLKFLKSAVSFVVLVACIGLILSGGKIHKQAKPGGFETNEAVTCLTNIIRCEEDFTWTICSANDELRMGEDHGYHYEIITFLKKMEKYNKEKIITIPTPKVYFFIEKVPIDYAVSYKNSGQTVSEEGASRGLSYSASLAPYQGENRWVTMSRMYYWAQEFQKMYPNEMKVYMETDQFVCYVVEQNTYSLYNFAIDYGYNMGVQPNE